MVAQGGQSQRVTNPFHQQTYNFPPMTRPDTLAIPGPPTAAPVQSNVMIKTSVMYLVCILRPGIKSFLRQKCRQKT